MCIKNSNAKMEREYKAWLRMKTEGQKEWSRINKATRNKYIHRAMGIPVCVVVPCVTAALVTQL
jgi:hypothetical protein